MVKLNCDDDGNDDDDGDDDADNDDQNEFTCYNVRK
jgi:hypothetical protein